MPVAQDGRFSPARFKMEASLGQGSPQIFCCGYTPPLNRKNPSGGPNDELTNLCREMNGIEFQGW